MILADRKFRLLEAAVVGLTASTAAACSSQPTDEAPTRPTTSQVAPTEPEPTPTDPTSTDSIKATTTRFDFDGQKLPKQFYPYGTGIPSTNGNASYLARNVALNNGALEIRAQVDPNRRVPPRCCWP